MFQEHFANCEYNDIGAGCIFRYCLIIFKFDKQFFSCESSTCNAATITSVVLKFAIFKEINTEYVVANDSTR